MQDIEALAERIILIGRGRVLMDGTLETMKELSREYVMQESGEKSSGGSLDQVVAGLYQKLDIL